MSFLQKIVRIMKIVRFGMNSFPHPHTKTHTKHTHTHTHTHTHIHTHTSTHGIMVK